MKSYLPLIGLLALAACSREDKSKAVVAIPGLTLSTPAPSLAPKTVLVMGQSNAVRLNPAGYKGFEDARSNPGDTFINCAENGTTMTQWDPSGSRVANCVNVVAGRHIDVIIWWQGESDANPSIGGSSSDYAYKATQLFATFRSKFGNVPIIFAQIAVIGPNLAPNFPNWQEVKDQQASIFYPNTAMVKTDDIMIGNPLTLDGIHFDDSGDYEAAARFARAYTNLGGN